MVGVLQHQHIGQRRGFGDVAAANDITFTVRVFCALDVQGAQRAPGLTRRGAAAGDLAGFGAAVDFHQHALQRRFCLLGQLGRQRCGGRQGQRHRRQSQLGKQERLQVKRRGDECTRRRHALQRVGDVGRVERPAGVEGGAAQQRQQHGGLEPVAVLRRHGGHHRDAGQRGPLQKVGQPFGLGSNVGHQRAPAFGMRLRRAGAAAGEQADGFQVNVDLRHRRGRLCLGRAAHGVHAQAAGVWWRTVGHAAGRLVGHVVDQQVGRAIGRRHSGHLAQGVRQCIRRHQARLPAQQRRRQAQGKEVAVLAQVDGPAGRQTARHRLGFGDEERGRDRPAGAPGQRLRQVARAQQGQRDAQPSAPLWDWPDRWYASKAARIVTRGKSGWRW